MASGDSDDDSDPSSVDFSSSLCSDIDINGNYDSFSSDTDEDNIHSQSSLETFSSRVSNPEDPDFWSGDLHPVLRGY